MKKYLISIIILFISFTIMADDKLVETSFGPVQIGIERFPIDLRDFKINIKQNSSTKIKTGFIRQSVQWVRTAGNLLTPRARIGIMLFDIERSYHFRYLETSIIPAKKENYYYTELYLNLFSPDTIKIMQNDHEIGFISITALKPRNKTKTHFIDYSCAPYGVTLEGLVDEYITVGCRMDRTGKFGNENPRLEISWMATNLKLADLSNPPYLSILTSTYPVEVDVVDRSGVLRKIKISANLPKKMHRFNTAFGLGPYSFSAKEKGETLSPKASPSLMLYGNLFLSDETSIRMFDALIYQESLFNNFGFYFAYDLASAFDNRIKLIPLLGIQSLTFRYNKSSGSYSEVIYPQGFELMYKHAFGIENYLVVYGMFLSTTTDVNYKNLWLRWGKKYFWEVNYIEWGDKGRNASMYGVSIGFPLAKFF